jgi:hypothetical protein
MFWRALARLIGGLTSLVSLVLVPLADRIAADCNCTTDTALQIRNLAAVVILAFIVGLIALSWVAIRNYVLDARADWLAAPTAWNWIQDQNTEVRQFLMRQWMHVHASFVPWIMAVVGIAALTVPVQTHDMLAGIQGREPEDFDARVWFAIGAAAWSLSTWYCGRWAISMAYGTSGFTGNRLATWNPRVMSVLTSFAIITITARSTGLCSIATREVTCVALGVFAFTVMRRYVGELFVGAWTWLERFRPIRFINFLARLIPGLFGLIGYVWGKVWNASVPLLPGYFIYAARQASNLWRLIVVHLRLAPGGWFVVCVAFAVSVWVIASFADNPQNATEIQAPGTVLLGLGCLTLIATFISEGVYRLTRFPLLPILIIGVPMFASGWGVNHHIRTLPDDQTSLPAAPPSQQNVGKGLDGAAVEWLRQCGPNLIENNEIKVVLVSSAGGASRAALWTFHALSELEKQDNQFPRRVFAVSAVSGGALGAAVWSSLLARDNFDCHATITDPTIRDNREKIGHAILSHDFLAPVLAAWLSRDIPLGVVPLNPILSLFHIHPEDRAIALEKSWEQAWADTPALKDEPNLMASGFPRLWDNGFNRPLLLLNGTVESTGLPIVTAPFSIVNENGTPRLDMPATYDARFLLHHEVSVSTAVSNAARFPLVSPQGDIQVRTCPDGSLAYAGSCQKNAPSKADSISIVDGGYFDNLGGGATLRAAAALRQGFETLRLLKEPPFTRDIRLRIMVVAISSDPDRLITEDPDPPAASCAAPIAKPHERVNQLMRCEQDAPTLAISPGVVSNALNAEIAPFLAIVATQSGHTAARMAELNERFCPKPEDVAPDTGYVVLSLCSIDKDIPLSLNWVMPRVTRRFFESGDRCHRTLATLCGNDEELARYQKWMGNR